MSIDVFYQWHCRCPRRCVRSGSYMMTVKQYQIVLQYCRNVDVGYFFSVIQNVRECSLPNINRVSAEVPEALGIKADIDIIIHNSNSGKGMGSVGHIDVLQICGFYNVTIDCWKFHLISSIKWVFRVDYKVAHCFGKQCATFRVFGSSLSTPWSSVVILLLSRHIPELEVPDAGLQQ